MKISEYQRGYQDAAREMITWLHEEAARMNDPHARRLLNSADFALGVRINDEENKRAVEIRNHPVGTACPHLPKWAKRRA